MPSPPFVHLHCHSHYSLLDGASPIDKLVARAKSLGMNGLAITDHGNLHGALEFYQEARKAGINPIIGYEAYVAPETRFKHESTGGRESNYHLTLLAQNRTGFRNLIKLSSLAYLEGLYSKPRIDRELLEQYHDGIICLSGCVSSEFSKAILKGQDPTTDDFAEAQEIATWFHRVFGDRYFIEIQNNGLEIQRRQMEGAVQIARRMGIPLVATCDAHYVNQEDAEAQDVLLCINTLRFRSDTNRMRMETNQFYLRSQQEMYESFAGLEEAVKQSQLIADGINIELELGKRHFPNFTPPEEKSPPDYLRDLCLQGLRERYADKPARWASGELAPDVLSRLDHELHVINTLGFPNYFLIVWDFVRYARERNIPATARGSGVGSLVAYALYLSHICPLEYDLLFERFLDLSRREAPDIDIDFCKDRRGEVIQYVKDKYGEANVAQIGTFGTLAARAAIRDVGRALAMPIPRVDSIIAMVPEVLNITLDEALAQSADLKRAYQSDSEIRELLDLARKIEGLARNVGTHAAAVVIADRPLTEYVPLCRVQSKDEIITQWAMEDVERAGLLKMDFLGLRNLTILSKAVDIIEQTTGRRVDPYKFPLDDQPTFDLLCRGETKGIFQLESGGIRDLLQKMKPDHFRDIIATNALYRPGPLEGGMVDDYVQVKHGRKRASYLHPVMKDVLEETHGVMVYQEQVMRILNRLGGIDLADAYTCIKAISKKNLPTIAKYQEQFVAGARQQGLTERQAEELFELIAKFAGYGFNKSHSTAYALIAYMTAYLKAHYPLEFMAALLAGDIDARNFKKKDSLVDHMEDCRRMGVEVVPPDVNQSQADFSVRDGKITFALSAIKGCGGAAGAAIAAARNSGGPFKSIFDFCERCDPSQVNRTAIESLIKAGAFDKLHSNRAATWQALDRALQAGAARLADRRAGQKGLFESPEDDSAHTADQSLSKVSDWAEKERLVNEKEVLGFYLTSHPLAEYQSLLATYCQSTSALAALPPRSEVTVGGIISAIKHSHVKNPRQGSTITKYAMFDLEDLDGLVRSIAWPEEFNRYAELIQADAVVALRGTVDRRPGSEEANIIVNEIFPIADLSRRATKGVLIRVFEDSHGISALDNIRQIVAAHPGNCELQLLLCLAEGSRLHLKSALAVELAPEFRQKIDELLGPGNFRPLASPSPAGSGPPRNGRPRRPVAAL
jgi:DNA polymerase III subunit alpha